MTYFPDTAQGQTADALPVAGALAGSHIIVLRQGATDVQTTLGMLQAFLGAATIAATGASTPAPVPSSGLVGVAITGLTTTLTPSGATAYAGLHDGTADAGARQAFTGASLPALTPPANGTYTVKIWPSGVGGAALATSASFPVTTLATAAALSGFPVAGVPGSALNLAGASITLTPSAATAYAALHDGTAEIGGRSAFTGTVPPSKTPGAAGTFTYQVFATATGGTPLATSAAIAISASPSIAVDPVTAPAPGASLALSGTYSGFTPAGLEYSTDGGTTYIAATAPTIGAGRYSLTIASGLPAGTYALRLRDPAQPAAVGVSNSFTVAAVGGTITAPASPAANTTPNFAVTVTGSGGPSVWASVTVSGTEQTPRTQVAFGSTSVALTIPSAAAGVVCSASIYTAATAGALIASSAAFTPAAASAVPGQPSGLVLGTPTSTTMPMTWVPPASGAAPTGYALELSTDGGVTFAAPVAIPSVDTYYVATGLVAGTSYVGRITATSAGGPGPVSANSAAKSTLAAGAAYVALAAPATGTVGTALGAITYTGNQTGSFVSLMLAGVDWQGAAATQRSYTALSTAGGSLHTMTPGAPGTYTVRVYNSANTVLLAESRPIVVADAPVSRSYAVTAGGAGFTVTVTPALPSSLPQNNELMLKVVIKNTATSAAYTANSNFGFGTSATQGSLTYGVLASADGSYHLRFDTSVAQNKAATKYLWMVINGVWVMIDGTGIAVP